MCEDCGTSRNGQPQDMREADRPLAVLTKHYNR